MIGWIIIIVVILVVAFLLFRPRKHDSVVLRGKGRVRSNFADCCKRIFGGGA